MFRVLRFANMIKNIAEYILKHGRSDKTRDACFLLQEIYYGLNGGVFDYMEAYPITDKLFQEVICDDNYVLHLITEQQALEKLDRLDAMYLELLSL